MTMITERNMIFANPQAYKVFPQIGNPYNTGLVDTAIYTGHLVVTDTSGNTKNFSNTRTIDFTGFQGTIDIDQYTDTGSVKLGRWDTDKIGITHYEMEIIPIYEAPYTPSWSIGFSMTNQGTAANTITNGIEILQTGADPDHDDNNFFGYTDELYEGERFYSATIQVSGLPEGYTIIGIHGWDGVTITQDGEYTLPEFTWTNPDGYPDGTSIPYQDVPSLRFADGTKADVVFDTPITIVITSVETE